MSKAITDEQLAANAQNGDKNAAEMLIRRYNNLVMKCTRPYFIIGQEQDDLIQEGMIGLYKAVMTYRCCENTKFITHAYQCIKSSVLDAIRSAARNKHRALNNYTPLINSDGAEDLRLLPHEDSPEDAAERLEADSALMTAIIALLSKSELAVYHSYMSGLAMSEIASALNLTYKAVDNALQRIRKKVKLLINTEQC